MANFEIATRSEVGRNAWDKLVDESNEAWLWHRFAFQDALATWPHRVDTSFAIVDPVSQDSLLAVVPMQSIGRKISHTAGIAHLSSLGGVACVNDLSRKQRKAILDLARSFMLTLASKFNAIDIDITLSPLAPAFRGSLCPRINPLLALSASNTLTQTWVVDLAGDVNDLWRNMEGRARTAVRKAEKSGVTVRPANRDGDLDIYYALHTETYRRTGVPPHPRAYFEAIWRNF
ncbi:MAG: peptidoglycan bridge formation glycyltransferase FemA/FemB family protein, partial [Gammaproteobacteria bacterium]|nr:peptidoglycan bridge formation glycyltransferase FemA/FemB family protein [Gammaproteobacteria bacterium]